MARKVDLSVLIGAFGGSLLHAATVSAADGAAEEPSARAVPDATYAGMREKDVVLRLRGGLEAKGRLIADDADTVTVVQAGGSLATIRKDDVEALREAAAAAADDELPPGGSGDGDAGAAERRADGDDAPAGFRKSGGYFLAAPGILSQQFYLYNGSSGYDGYDGYAGYGGKNQENHTFYRWGLSVGGHLATKGAFTFQGGFAFQHSTGSMQEFGPFKLRSNLVRFGPEFRLGGSTRNFFGYGLLGVHGVVQNFKLRVPDGYDDYGDDSDTFGGLGGSIGGGAQGLVLDRLILGGELKIPVDYVFSKSDNQTFDAGGMKLVAIDLAFFLGVKF